MARMRTFLTAAAVLIGAAVFGGAAWKEYVAAPRHKPVQVYRLPDPPGYQEWLPKQPAANDPTEAAAKSNPPEDSDSPVGAR